MEKNFLIAISFVCSSPRLQMVKRVSKDDYVCRLPRQRRPTTGLGQVRSQMTMTDCSQGKVLIAITANVKGDKFLALKEKE